MRGNKNLVAFYSNNISNTSSSQYANIGIARKRAPNSLPFLYYQAKTLIPLFLSGYNLLDIPRYIFFVRFIS